MEASLEPPFQSFLASGYGVAALQAPERSAPRAFALNFGRMGWGHGHADRLGLHVLAFGAMVTPDLGYPTRAQLWPDAHGFSIHVVSHNTVMVDEQNMDRTCSYSGKTQLFGSAGPLRVMDIDGGGEPTTRGEGHARLRSGKGGPPFPGVKTYRRCVVMVDVDDQQSYAIDLFWVRGGNVHRLIQNAGGPEATVNGAALTPQSKGTYAGEDVPFGKFYDQPLSGNYSGTGFMFLDRVEKGAGSKPFQVDWAILDPETRQHQGNFRIHNLTPVDEVALMDGHPPKHLGNPETLRYLHRTRRGGNLSSQFLTVLEPYPYQPFIRKATALVNEETPKGFIALVKVELADGRTDYVAIAENEGVIAWGDLKFKGRVGLHRAGSDDAPLEQALIAATEISVRDARLTLPETGTRGVLRSTAQGSEDTQLNLEMSGSLAQDAVGRTVIFDNHERSDAAFLIRNVQDGTAVNIGPLSLFERFIDPAHHERGHTEVIAPGDAFFIPASKHIHCHPTP